MEGLSETFEELGDVPLGYESVDSQSVLLWMKITPVRGFLTVTTPGSISRAGFAREVFDYMAENFSNAGYWEDIAHTSSDQL